MEYCVNWACIWWNIIKYFSGNTSIYYSYTNCIRSNSIFRIRLYKEIIINLSKYTQKIIDNKLLEDLILSNKYDDNLIEVSNNILKNKQDIKFFKLTLVRMILSSTFIIELSLMQEFLSKHQNLSESGLVTTPELIFINYCIENNDFCLPTDENILENMLNLFIVYNKTNNNDKIAYAEKNYPHELKKIYPLYMFDKLN